VAQFGSIDLFHTTPCAVKWLFFAGEANIHPPGGADSGTRQPQGSDCRGATATIAAFIFAGAHAPPE
jgi:hypothetical protein